jgi:hypothetical protein
MKVGSMSSLVNRKERDAIILSLRAGVVPRWGQHLLRVGRTREIETLVSDIERVGDGGSSFRLVIGESGVGKTFLLKFVRAVALEKKLAVASADINRDRLLHASGGQARALYGELMRGMSTRAKPDGGALPEIVEKFISAAKLEAKASGQPIAKAIRTKLEEFTELENGDDFADVIAVYHRGFEEGNEQLKSAAIRWLRGEFSTKTDAKRALSVRNIVDDSAVYNSLRMMARFVRLAGYAGLLVSLDGLVNLCKLTNTQARNSNYEQILRMLDDSLKGAAIGLGFTLGGTSEFLLDSTRGLYSNSALQSRLARNTFAADELADFSGPAVWLSRLTRKDSFVLLQRIRHIYALGDVSRHLLPDQGIASFLEYCSNWIGDPYLRTPRTTITSFVNLLSVLEQNPGVHWTTVLRAIEYEPGQGQQRTRREGQTSKGMPWPASDRMGAIVAKNTAYR